MLLRWIKRHVIQEEAALRTSARAWPCVAHTDTAPVAHADVLSEAFREVRVLRLGEDRVLALVVLVVDEFWLWLRAVPADQRRCERQAV